MLHVIKLDVAFLHWFCPKILKKCIIDLNPLGLYNMSLFCTLLLNISEHTGSQGEREKGKRIQGKGNFNYKGNLPAPTRRTDARACSGA